MKSQYQLYGVPLSLFVGKVRGYLNYKGLDYQETAPTVYDLLIRFPKKVGAAVMPVIKSRDGEWLADTTFDFVVLPQGWFSGLLFSFLE